MIARLQRAAPDADDEGRAATPSQGRGVPRAAVQRSLRCRREEGEQPGDPFAYSDLRGDEDLAVPISKYPDGSPSWEGTVADWIRMISELTDQRDIAATGRFQRANRDTLDQMWQAIATPGRWSHTGSVVATAN
jgi:hypothetical protein